MSNMVKVRVREGARYNARVEDKNAKGGFTHVAVAAGEELEISQAHYENLKDQFELVKAEPKKAEQPKPQNSGNSQQQAK